jgi:phospholipase/carboxylesterase
MQMLLQISATGSWDALRRQHPPGIDQASEQLVECIEAAQADLGRRPTSLVIGGFSQGAMLSMHVAAKGLGKTPDGLLLYSGTLVCEEQWRAAARARFKDLPIVQSHGRWDSILPYPAAEALRDLLIEGDANLAFVPFDGDHTICEAAIDETTRLLEKLS